MTTRLPNKRYIGDGVYAVHDGNHLIIETQDGIWVKNRIELDDNVLNGLMKYLEYAKDFYRTGQHPGLPGLRGLRPGDHRPPGQDPGRGLPARRRGGGPRGQTLPGLRQDRHTRPPGGSGEEESRARRTKRPGSRAGID